MLTCRDCRYHENIDKYRVWCRYKVPFIVFSRGEICRNFEFPLPEKKAVPESKKVFIAKPATKLIDNKLYRNGKFAGWLDTAVKRRREARKKSFNKYWAIIEKKYGTGDVKK